MPQPRLSVLAVSALTLVAVLMAAPAFAARGIITKKPSGGATSGRLVDNKTGEEMPFVQPNAAELGLDVGTVVTFERVVPSGQSSPVAVVVRPAGRRPLPEESGRIVTIRRDGSGVAEVRKTGARLAFTQPFSEELGLSAGVEVDFFVLPGTGGAVLSAIINTSRSNIKSIAFQLDGGSPIDIVSVEGGQPIPDYAFDEVAPFQSSRRLLGRTKYANIVLRMAMNPDATLAAWMAETLSGKVKTRTGNVIVFDDAREVARLSFTGALITEIRMPALDAASKDTSYLKIAIAPDTTVMTSRAGFRSGTSFTIDAKSQKAFLPSNFRIRLDGALLSHVDKVDAFTIKQKVSYGPGSFPAYHLTQDPVMSEGVTTEFHGLIEAGPFEEGVRLALQGIDIDHSVEIEYFNERGDSLLVVKQTLGVFKVTPEKVESQGDSLRVTLISDRDTVTFLWPKVSVR